MTDTGKTEMELSHRAVVIVTGWAGMSRGRALVGGYRIQSVPLRFQGTRVTATLFPRTDGLGHLSGVQRYGSMQRARQANGTSFDIIGRLIRVETSEQKLTLQVYPTVADTIPFRITVRATPGLLVGTDPSWGAVRIAGGLIDNVLVADMVRPVQAPVPARWSHWTRGQPPVRLTEGEQDLSAQKPVGSLPGCPLV